MTKTKPRGLQGDPTSPFWRRSDLGFLWKEWCWSWISNPLTTSAKSLLIGKDSAAGRDWGQEEKGTTEGEMAGWHHWLDGREFVWTPAVGGRQGGLACCHSWGLKSRTRLSDWTELKKKRYKWTLLTKQIGTHRLICPFLRITFLYVVNYVDIVSWEKRIVGFLSWFHLGHF